MMIGIVALILLYVALGICLYKLYDRVKKLDDRVRAGGERFTQHRVAELRLIETQEEKLRAVEEKLTEVEGKLTEVEEKNEQLKKMIPADIAEEMLRRDVLLRELNDEMERGLKMEKSWNDGLQSILNYSAATGTEAKNE